MSDTLLLVVAGTNRHTPALQRTFDLALRAEVPVHIVLPVFDPLIERSGTFVHADVRRTAQEKLVARHQSWLDELMQRWRADGLRVTGEVLWAPVPHAAIVARATELQPALLIKDVGHQPLLKRLLFSALEWKLLRYSPVPVMLVHELSTHLPRRIAAAVDTSLATDDAAALNRRIVQTALKLADWTDGDADVVHVFPYVPHGEALAGLEGVYAAARNADVAAFTAFATDLQVPPPARHWLEGSPVHRLVEFAKAQPVDLLVLGAAYHSTLDRLLMGSTAESLLFQIPCDVLLLKRAD